MSTDPDRVDLYQVLQDLAARHGEKLFDIIDAAGWAELHRRSQG
jgi:hypothetical protein